jgi:hypothetical protein
VVSETKRSAPRSEMASDIALLGWDRVEKLLARVWHPDEL